MRNVDDIGNDVGGHDDGATTGAVGKGRAPIGRRGFVIGAAGVVVGAGLGVVARPAYTAIADALAAGEEAAAEETEVETVRRYVSSSVNAPILDITRRPGTTPSPGLLFAAVGDEEAHTGVIFDDDGEPVWVEPNGLNIMDLRVQQYRGEPVLTYWSGTIKDGYGHGAGTILDSSYREIARIVPSSGYTHDLHELLLTSEGTALIMSYPTIAADLRSVDGPRDGFIFDNRVEEVDIATGDLLMTWNASDHIDVDESFQPLAKTGTTAAEPWDPFHLNSIDVDTSTDVEALLISARHTHSIYSIDRSTGEIIWRMHGKKSDFTVPDDVAFAWQHDARRLPDGSISLFDNHEKEAPGESRGLVLTVDDTARSVSSAQTLRYKSTFGGAMGNVQVLTTGNAVVGWGTGDGGTEFEPDGRAIHHVAMRGNSYRMFRSGWSARPASEPAVAAVRDASDGLSIYATWNGATDVASWRFDTGERGTSLSPAVTVERSGFETDAAVPAAAYVRAVALDSAGTVIGTSAVVAV